MHVARRSVVNLGRNWGKTVGDNIVQMLISCISVLGIELRSSHTLPLRALLPGHTLIYFLRLRISFKGRIRTGL